MANFDIELSYKPDTVNNELTLQTPIMSPPSSDGKTFVEPDGDITVGVGDSVTVKFAVEGAGWYLTELQLKDSGRTAFGPQPKGKNRLTAEEVENFGIDAFSGTKFLLDQQPSFTLNNSNRKKCKVNYCIFASNGTRVLVSDPRMKDNGGAEN